MKSKRLFALMALSLACIAGFGQSTHPIITRVVHHDPDLLVYGRPKWSRLILGAALDKKTHIYYLMTAYGYVSDSSHVTDDDYQMIVKGKVTPFDHFNITVDTMLSLIETARFLIQHDGKLKPTWKHTDFIYACFPEFKTGKSTSRKLYALDDLKSHLYLQKWLINADDPMHVAEDSSTFYASFEQSEPGTMLVKKDTIIYYNSDNISITHKAILYNRLGKICYYNMGGEAVDSIMIDVKKVPLLISDKADIFILYKAWLDTEKAYLVSEIKKLKQMQRLPTDAVRQVKLKTSAEPLQSEATERLEVVKEKIEKLVIPDYKALTTQCRTVLAILENVPSLCSVLGVPYTTVSNRGNKRYELTDHRGNIMAVVSDRKIQVDANNDGKVDYYVPDVVSATDYYAYGMQEPGRAFSKEGYRYGFNGKENDNEVKGTGVQYDYGFRIYDPRLGRFLSVDPLTKAYPWYTPYQFAGNKPITKIDLDGLEEFDFREINQDDGSVLVVITTGKHLLNQRFQNVSTSTGNMFTFKYAQIQETLSKAKYNEVFSPGSKEVTGFTMDLPITKNMEVFPGPGQTGEIRTVTNPATTKNEPWLTNASSIAFRLKNPEKYVPKIFGEGQSGEGNQVFTFNVQMTSGNLQFEYGSAFVPDKYIITDADGIILAQTNSVSGEGSLNVDFKDLKTPIINVQVISSDEEPTNSKWFFKIRAQEQVPQEKKPNNDEKKSGDAN